jgi:GDP-4-dehydro-6-deoxy-D-mannose reductase
LRAALVTGASGFIGRHLCAALTARGVAVTPFGRIKGDPASWSLDRLVETLKRSQPDILFHLAGATTGDLSTLRSANVELTRRLLAAVAALDNRLRVVVAGSAAEYGPVQTADGELLETAACAPMSDYGVSKLEQTTLALTWGQSNGEVVVARIANPVGAGMPETLAVGSFYAQVRALPQVGGVLKVGDLASARDFIAVGDTAAQLIALAQIPAAAGHIVNVCSGRPTPVGAFVEALRAISGKDFAVEVDSARVRPGSPAVLYSSSRRLRGFGIDPARPDPMAMAAAAYGSLVG